MNKYSDLLQKAINTIDEENDVSKFESLFQEKTMNYKIGKEYELISFLIIRD